MTNKGAFTKAGNKQRLLPVKVPWEVSPSTPFLRYSGAEAELPLEITFVGHFGLEDELDSEQVQADLHSTHSVRLSYIEAGEAGGPFQLVQMSFGIGCWLRVSPSYSDREVVEESAYDWSAIPCLTEVSQLNSFKIDFMRKWRLTGICPDPRMYEVDKSTWLQQVNEEDTHHHFLILGHDVFIEVLAENWNWKSLGRIKGW